MSGQLHAEEDKYIWLEYQVPLLDMFRFNKLLVGASWVGEYGNPDIPEEWAYIKSYSPYHHLHKDVHYPKVFSPPLPVTTGFTQVTPVRWSLR